MRMRRIIALALAAGMLVAGFGGPADAKKKKKVKAITTTLYLHGTSMFGEQDSFVQNTDYLPMDTTEPGAGTPKSKGILNYVVGPNTVCAGNNLFPVWTGNVAGTIKGDMTLKFFTIGTPGPVEIRVWPDVTSTLCDSDFGMEYVQPAGSVTVDLPPGPGEIEAVIKGVNFKAAAFLMVQISPALTAGVVLVPMVNRVEYDSADAPSALTFKCTPNPGKKACA